MRHVLDEITLLLGLGVDRGTSGGLGLVTAAGSGPRASEHRSEDTHGELLHGLAVSVRVGSAGRRTGRKKG